MTYLTLRASIEDTDARWRDLCEQIRLYSSEQETLRHRVDALEAVLRRIAANCALVDRSAEDKLVAVMDTALEALANG